MGKTLVERDDRQPELEVPADLDEAAVDAEPESRGIACEDSVEKADEATQQAQRRRRRLKVALIGGLGAAGVGVAAWGLSRLLLDHQPISSGVSGEQHRGLRLFDGYSPALAEDDGTPPTHWQRPSPHDAMYRRYPGSFEGGKRR